MGVKVKYVILKTCSSPTEVNWQYKHTFELFATKCYIDLNQINCARWHRYSWIRTSVGSLNKYLSLCYRAQLSQKIKDCNQRKPHINRFFKSDLTHRWKSNIDLPSPNANEIKITIAGRKRLLFALAINDIDGADDLSISSVLKCDNAMWILRHILQLVRLIWMLMKTSNDEYIDGKSYFHACVIAPQWGTFRVIIICEIFC